MEVDSVHTTLEHMWDKQPVYAASDLLCFMRQARVKQPYTSQITGLYVSSRL